MSFVEMRTWLRTLPFVPFEAVTSDGEAYFLSHRELLVVVEEDTLHMHEPTHEGEPERVVLAIALNHITTIRPKEPATLSP